MNLASRNPVTTLGLGASRHALVAIASALILSSLGCRLHAPIGPDKCANITPGAIPAKTGTQTCQWQAAQADRAEAGKYVINQSEWFMGGKTLGPDGRRHVELIAKRVSQTPYPVVISISDNDDLDAARRQIIVDKLTCAGLTDADERVVIGKPLGEGLYGLEAARYGGMRMIGLPGSLGIGGGGGGGGGIGGGMGGIGGGGGGMGGGMGGIGGGMGGGMY